MKIFLLGAVFLLGLYLIFAGQASADELAFGSVCALLATVWAALVLHVAPNRMVLSFRALLPALRTVAAVPIRAGKVGVALIAAILGRPVTGRVELRRFAPGHDADPDDSGRRAAVLLTLSLAPDSFVLHLRAERQELDIHRLVEVREGGNSEWPA